MYEPSSIFTLRPSSSDTDGTMSMFTAANAHGTFQNTLPPDLAPAIRGDARSDRDPFARRAVPRRIATAWLPLDQEYAALWSTQAVMTLFSPYATPT